jgi:hypothetical protein
MQRIAECASLLRAAKKYLARNGGPLPLDVAVELMGYGVDVRQLEMETEEKQNGT